MGAAASASLRCRNAFNVRSEIKMTMTERVTHFAIFSTLIRDQTNNNKSNDRDPREDAKTDRKNGQLLARQCGIRSSGNARHPGRRRLNRYRGSRGSNIEWRRLDGGGGGKNVL